VYNLNKICLTLMRNRMPRPEDALAAYAAGDAEQGFNAEQLAAGDAFFKSVNIPFAQNLHHVTPV
jgi:hypothetical protein